MSDDIHSAISSIDEIIEDARNGRMFILVDAEDRENEGDLVIPASFATPEAVNFMAREGRGLICVPMEGSVCERLDLPMQASHNTNAHGTAFTISITDRTILAVLALAISVKKGFACCRRPITAPNSRLSTWSCASRYTACSFVRTALSSKRPSASRICTYASTADEPSTLAT